MEARVEGVEVEEMGGGLLRGERGGLLRGDTWRRGEGGGTAEGGHEGSAGGMA